MVEDKHLCSECEVTFRTEFQLRNHFAHKHKSNNTQISGSGE